MKLRELPDVLRCRPRECDVLGETDTETAALFGLVLFDGYFEH